MEPGKRPFYHFYHERRVLDEPGWDYLDSGRYRRPELAWDRHRRVNNNHKTYLLLGALLALGAGGVFYMHTRGFRNNNPGNLKAGTPWKGAVGVDRAGFAIFDTMANGVRALGMDLTAKMNRGLNTISEILDVYAPASENPTATYKAKLAEWVGVGIHDPLNGHHLPNLIDGIIRFENGKRLDQNTIYAGIRAMAA